MDARVAVVARCRVLLDVPVAAVDLNQLVDHVAELLAGQHLGDRALDGVLLERCANGVRAARILGRRKAALQQAADAVDARLDRVGASGDGGELGADEREVGQLAAERHALARVPRCDGERWPHAAERRGPELEASDVEDVEGDPMALARLAEQRVLRHDHAVQRDRAGRGAVEAHLLLLRADAQPGRVTLDEEGAECFAVDLGVHREQVGEAGVGDELLGAVELPAPVWEPGGAGADAHRIGPRCRLGEAVGADTGAIGQARQVALLLRIGAEEDDRQRADPGVRRVRHGEGAGGRDRLVDDQAADAVQASTTVLLGNIDAEEAIGPELLEERPVRRVVLALDLVASGRNLLVDEGRHRLTDGAVLVGELLRREDRSRLDRPDHEAAAWRRLLPRLDRHAACSS